MVVSAREVVRRARLRSLPHRGADQLERHRWLVLAPHPDDETLGTGALLCALADAGRPAQVVYLTDGDASHPGSRHWPPGRLAALRRREARAALRALAGSSAPSPIFLGWPDAAPWPEGSAQFAAAVSRIAGLLRRLRISALATTWPQEPHCDHGAAASLARAAARSRRGVALYWCVVWGWGAPSAPGLVARPALSPPQGPSNAGRRRAALFCHRSQLGSVVDDSPKGFRLPRAMVRSAADAQILFGPEVP